MVYFHRQKTKMVLRITVLINPEGLRFFLFMLISKPCYSSFKSVLRILLFSSRAPRSLTSSSSRAHRLLSYSVTINWPQPLHFFDMLDKLDIDVVISARTQYLSIECVSGCVSDR